MTSNLGTSGEQFRDIEAMRRSVMDAMQRAFRPEFLNRLDDIVLFRPLGPTRWERITRLQLRALEKKLADHGLNFRSQMLPCAIWLAAGWTPFTERGRCAG
jgi:ATP-dependent Clp protease ATP-binding subunit ClpB